MAVTNTFKTIDPTEDIVTSKTLLNENVPITGSIVSGTYGGATVSMGSEGHIKTYSHGMFQSVFDYPYLSSSANHIFDIAVGISANSSIYSSTTSQQAKKKNVYNQMAQVLMGHDATGSIKEFKIPDGNYIREAIFLNFSRLLVKDEIKKTSFNLKMGSASWTNPFIGTHKIDTISEIPKTGGQQRVYTDSPAGEYTVLTSSVSNTRCGLLFYQAGIAVLSTASFMHGKNPKWSRDTGQHRLDAALTASTVDTVANGFRHNMYNVEFNNTTELNSTMYFCKVNNNDFNYSSNPTYLSSSKIRVKETSVDPPVSYVTSIGLYSANNELLAVAKLSEPLKNTPSERFTLRVRLDY